MRIRSTRLKIGQIARVLLYCVPLALTAAERVVAEDSVGSSFRVVSDEAADSDNASELIVHTAIKPLSGETTPCPVRAIVTGSDGRHCDGAGKGLYRDGRFFADGQFRVVVPPGKTSVKLSHGPNCRPLEFSLDVPAGRKLTVEAMLHQWFAPEPLGWYAADNHVHAQHDRTAQVQTSLDYTALQARANGLSWVTEAGSEVSYARLKELSSESFLLRHAQELRPGPFVGHLNTPGLRDAIDETLLARLTARPLPVQAIVDEVHRRDGAVIHTHLMTPRHQVHWMGATEAYSDAVLGRPADAWDIYDRHSELLWFAALNLGNRIAVSSSTDSALGRVSTLSPGDRRVYIQAEKLNDASIVAGLRQGRTIATNGGPIFAQLHVDGAGPGATIRRRGGDTPLPAEVIVHSLFPLQSVELYCDGRRVQAFDVSKKSHSGQSKFHGEVPSPARARQWVVLRTQDDRGNWALTSPVYLESESADDASDRPKPASAAILQISNATRFIELRQQFFAHVIVTLGGGEVLARVELQRDGKPLRSFVPEQGNEIAGGKIPVTGLNGEYQKGWIWYPGARSPRHLQADWPIDQTGWYRLVWKTRSGRQGATEEIHFDATNPNSHQISLAQLRGPRTDFCLRGYGEEMPLAEIKLPFNGDHWWFPQNTYCDLTAQLGGQSYRLQTSADHKAAGMFRGDMGRETP